MKDKNRLNEDKKLEPRKLCETKNK